MVFHSATQQRWRAGFFFLLGGDSLRGTRLLVSVKAVFGVEVTLQARFDNAATVAGMARASEAARAANGTV